MPRKRIYANQQEQQRAAQRRRRAREGFTDDMARGKRVRLQRERQNAADQADAEKRAEFAHASQPCVVTYRDEKASAAKRLAAKIADAKRAYDALIASQHDGFRVGRPKKPKPPKFDPRDALLVALEGQQK